MSPSVGGRIARPDGPDKVAGRTRYVADLRVEGAWVGAAVRSNVARGRVLGLDVDPAFAASGAVLVLPRDIPGANVVAMIADDQPVLAEREIEHFGEPLADRKSVV